MAQRTGGQFVLRIEDTDRTRLVAGSEDQIYQTLEWLGLARMSRTSSLSG